MAKPLPPDQRKTRTAEHRIADLAVNRVEHEVLLARCTLQRIDQDYGLDAIMHVYNAVGELEDGNVDFQIKGGEQQTRIEDGTIVAFRVTRRDLLHWLAAPMPVLLAVYDHSRREVYYLYVQRYFETLPDFDLFAAGQTITIRIPATQVLNEVAVQQIAEYLRAVMQQLKGKVRHD